MLLNNMKLYVNAVIIVYGVAINLFLSFKNEAGEVYVRVSRVSTYRPIPQYQMRFHRKFITGLSLCKVLKNAVRQLFIY